MAAPSLVVALASVIAFAPAAGWAAGERAPTRLSRVLAPVQRAGQRAVQLASRSTAPGATSPRAATAAAPKDVPGNQPAARFAGHPATTPRPPDPRPPWLAGPIKKLGTIMGPSKKIAWQSRGIFNPSAIVHKGKVYMFFRAEDSTGPGEWHGTSRIGLAVSEDGIKFDVRDEPVLEPTESWEALGGVEDPRVVEIDGKFLMTYTAFNYNDKTARLALAVSDDLVHWEKKGLMVPNAKVAKNNPQWSKSGAIVPRKINGEYVMYFGDESMHIARSKDLVTWKVDKKPVIKPRKKYWDGIMVEPGPSPTIDADGNIHLLYNGDAPPDGYAAGEVVFSGKDPRKVLSRSNTPLIKVTEPWEKVGQVGNVIFLEGSVRLGDKHFFYYGAADDKVAVAVADAAKGAPKAAVATGPKRWFQR